MKRGILFLFFAGALLTSCKKDRVCTCNLTPVSSSINGVSQQISTTGRTVVTKYTNVTKKGAACTSGEKTTSSIVDVNGTTATQIDVEKADCSLQ